MNRDEKNLQTMQKIIDSALVEFSKKSYSEASLNTICATGNISKGIIYHYFKDKDTLYLVCVKKCFDALTSYLDDVVIIDNLSVDVALECYFDARIAFFREHQLYLGVFCSAIMNPPSHLLTAINEISSNFDAQTFSILTILLKTVKLRSDVTIEEVIKVFCEYQDFVNTRFQMKAVGKGTLKEHEARCYHSLQIMLYGVIAREVHI